LREKQSLEGRPCIWSEMETQVEITVKKKVKIYLKHYTDFQAPRVGVHQWFMGIEEKREIPRNEATISFLKDDKPYRRDTNLAYIDEFIEPALKNQENYEIDYKFVRGKLKSDYKDGIISRERFDDLMSRLDDLVKLVLENH